MAEVEKYTIYDLGYDRNLIKEDNSFELMKENILDSLDPNLLRSGNWIGNLVMSKGYLRSSNYIAGSLGWNIEFDGTAQFSDITLIGGTINYGKTSFADSTNAGYYISSDGWYIGAASDVSKIKYTIATGVIDFIGNISGRASSVISSAIDSSGHFVDLNLNTSAKTILGDFTFGVSGAIKMITDANNGLWLSPTGILGKKAGVNTFTIGIDGTATFAGTLSGASGTFGTITAGTLTGVTIQTAASGQRVKIDSSNNTISFYNASDAIVAQLGGGTEIANALRITLDSDTTTGIKITSAHASDYGLTYLCSGNYDNTGVNLQLTGATNTGTGLNIDHDGSGGEGIYVNTSAGARGLQIDNSGSGANLYLTSSASPSIYLSHTADSYIGFEIVYSGRQEALYIAGSDVNSTKSLIYATANQADGTATVQFNKSDYGAVLLLTSSNSSNLNYSIGLKMNIASSGSSVEAAFEFAGSEYIAAATAVSGLTGVIKIITADGLCYLPVYSAYS